MKKIGLKGRFVGTVLIASFICSAVAIRGFLKFNEEDLDKSIIDNEHAIHSQISAAIDFVAKQSGLDEIIGFYTKKYTNSDQLTEEDKQKIMNRVPIYAGMEIGKINQKEDSYEFRIFSDEPRNKKNQATPKEMEIFRKFDADPALTEWVDDNGVTITTYRPVRLTQKQGCFSCHGNPANSPWKNGTDILGYKMENWTEGKLHGVFAVSENVSEIHAAHIKGALISPSGWLILEILAGSIVACLIAIFLADRVVNKFLVTADLISNVSGHVGDASLSVAESSTELSEAGTTQAASIQQTAASLEEITAMIAKASESAQSAANTTDESTRKANDGKEAVERMLQSMDEISQSNQDIMKHVDESNRQMSEIVRVIEEIGQKTKVINEIVFQTKLLSFNASVEAARAGEHGKGFAVVAEEVGNLAQMSGNAAKEIGDMLSSSIAKVNSIVSGTREKVDHLTISSRQKVEGGVEVAKQCSDILNEIVDNISRVSELSQEISDANKEQTSGVQEINKAMSMLDSVTQANAAASQQSAKSADELSQQATELNRAVYELLAILKGGVASDYARSETQMRRKKGDLSGAIVSLQAERQKRQNKNTNKKESIKKAAGEFEPSRQDEGFNDV